MTETERAAIEAIRRYDPERIVTSQDGHAMTVGRLCELALAVPQGAAQALEKAALICEERADDDCAFAIRALASRLAEQEQKAPSGEGYVLVPKDELQRWLAQMLAAAPTNEEQR